MLYNIEQKDANSIYQLMTKTIIPRPIAWIVTKNNGIVNIAPFSFFTALSASPATVIVSIGTKKDNTVKDTMANILKNKKCTICMVDEHNLEKMHFSSKELAKNISEADEFDIKTKDMFEGFPPMIENASVAYSCTFNQLINLGNTRTQPIILNVQNIYINENQEYKPVARVSRHYSFLSENIEAPQIK